MVGLAWTQNQTHHPTTAMDVFQQYYQTLYEPGYTMWRLQAYRPPTEGLIVPELVARYVAIFDSSQELTDEQLEEKQFLIKNCQGHYAGIATAGIISLLRNLITLGLVLPTDAHVDPAVQERMEYLWKLLHHNFGHTSETADLAIKGLVFQVLMGTSTEQDGLVLFTNCKTLLERSDVVQAMLTRNADLALVTKYTWKRIEDADDDPAAGRFRIGPLTIRPAAENQNDHLFGKVLTGKDTPLQLPDMSVSLGKDMPIYNFPCAVFFTLRPTSIQEQQLTFSDLRSFRQSFYDWMPEEGPVYRANRREILYRLALIVRLDGSDNHIRVYDEWVQPCPPHFTDDIRPESRDMGEWAVETPNCELLLVYSGSINDKVTEESLATSHAQSNKQWIDEWGAHNGCLGNNILELGKPLRMQ